MSRKTKLTADAKHTRGFYVVVKAAEAHYTRSKATVTLVGGLNLLTNTQKMPTKRIQQLLQHEE